MHQSLQDWRQAVRMPTAYRVGNSTLRFQTQFVVGVAIIGVSFLILLYTLLPYTKHQQLVSDIHRHDEHGHQHIVDVKKRQWLYNSTYPLTPPATTPKGLRYRIAVISDLDTDSKDKENNFTWFSYLKKGYFTIDITRKYVNIEWDKDIIKLKSTLSQAGRGMELSELVVFNGKLLSFDDRTGVIYEISENKAIPWILLTDGNGRTTKGFKSEWATVKNQELYVGGLGKEWTSSTGKFLNNNPQWVKVVSPLGQVEHKDWRQNYLSLRKTAHIEFPGYMIHEAVVWSEVHKEWFFLPRRASAQAYNDKEDEKKGTNMLLRSNEDFTQITLTNIGPLVPTHGFSTFKFVPDTLDSVVIALKSEENEGHIATFVTIFTITGDIWMPETEIGSYKFEGIEFI
ncbi:soluble calcium-activated nucleotidase 1-like [Uloborus diversus]|uniref:soluble calcium-activated nucleotidase 1-like n=1 Tax=Uloborus diversus TaxID=327109 RepID=UPI0024093DD1|nr:soluble calcium-activated nucleotidase 1-like [Uloborus diversus]